VSPFLILGILIGILATPALNALALGDDVATGLGVRTGIIRIISAFAGVLLCGATTALAGPIGFVGLMIPHTMRLICGPNMRYIVPMSAVGGITNKQANNSLPTH
jgi:iron complex transport system permease protein